MKLRLKYCGGCNPVVNRTRIVEDIKSLLPGELIIATGKTDTFCDTGIILCGCETACADNPENRKLANKWIVISGSYVDYFPVNEDQLPSIVVNKIIQHLQLSC